MTWYGLRGIGADPQIMHHDLGAVYWGNAQYPEDRFGRMMATGGRFPGHGVQQQL